MNSAKEEHVRAKPIPEEKKKIVDFFKEKMANNRTVLIASCKSLPGPQFHEIKKKLRGKAEIKFARKRMILRAIDETDKGALKNLSDNLDSDFAMIFSDMDPFELSGVLIENQSAAKARAGDIAPEDISIEPGPTDLPAGPAISELQSVGLKVKVTDGKLEIMNGVTVAKKGEPIDEKVAGVLAKLNISPMKVGFLPIAAYDSENDKVYTDIVIDKEGTLAEMRDMIGKALGFAVNVGYPTPQTISYFIAKAASEEKAIAGLVKTDPSVPEEKPAEEEVKEEETEKAPGEKGEESNSTEDTKEEDKE